MYNLVWTLGVPEPSFAQEDTIKYTVLFKPEDKRVEVPSGSLIQDAALEAGVEINMPCGGQGRCGRCAVIVEKGKVRRRSTLRLSAQEVEEGWALACQTVIESDLVVTIPPQERIERRIPTARVAAKVALPFPYDWHKDQAIQKYFLSVEPPSLDDNTDDFSRLKRVLAKEQGIRDLVADLPLLRRVGGVLREADWQVTAVVELDTWASPDGPPRLVDILPGDETATSWGVAVDIGTTSNVVYLVDLLSGEMRDMATDYNGQIARGEDIISRIIYASQDGGLRELQKLVVGTINKLIKRVCGRQKIKGSQIYKMVAAGNSTMIHLFLAIPPESIRLEPYVTATNHPLPIRAKEIGIDINPEATIDCLPGVGSYVGADITAGVVSSDLCESKRLTIFMDIGTNGEIVLGDCDWLISCACSAGPAFEGAGVEHGMRATAGAIEEVWINGQTWEPTYRVIGSEAPRGLCGSALISLLAEMFITGIVDKRGRVREDLDTPRVREGEHGWEYVVAWGSETDHGRDIAITQVDIENLIRAKAAIHAGYSVLSKSLDIDISQVEDFLIAGAFGQYLNVERAIQIGLLPDLPWEKFKFLGNTSVRGAYMALLSRQARKQIAQIAQMMTYMELSADNRFTQEFVSALFLPHTHIEEYPSVMALLEGQ